MSSPVFSRLRNLKEPWRRKKLARLAKTYGSRALNKPLVRPKSVTLTLTTKCNLRCQMCEHWKLKPGSTMETRDAKRFLDQIADWGVETVDLSGGEPFVHPDFFEILDYASQKGLKSNITTNGMLLTNKAIRRLLDLNVERLQLSIDAPEAELHEKIRAKKGSFKRIMRAVDALNAARETRKMGLNCTTVVMHDNFTRLVEMHDFAMERGFDSITYQPVNDDNLNIRRVDIRNPLRVPLDKTDELDAEVDRLIALKRSGASIGNSVRYLEGMKAYFRNEVRDPVRCYAGFVLAVISPEGKMWSCMGDFADLTKPGTDIRSAWHSEAAKEKRKLIRRCPSPCLYPCFLEGDADSIIGAVRNVLC